MQRLDIHQWKRKYCWRENFIFIISLIPPTHTNYQLMTSLSFPLLFCSVSSPFQPKGKLQTLHIFSIRWLNAYEEEQVCGGVFSSRQKDGNITTSSAHHHQPTNNNIMREATNEETTSGLLQGGHFCLFYSHTPLSAHVPQVLLLCINTIDQCK